jgi:hypothetical protein
MGALGAGDGVIARVADRTFGDVAVSNGMVIAPGQQRGARGRAQRRVVHLRVPQAALGKLFEGRRGHDTAEDRVRAVARVVDQDQQHVWRILRRSDGGRPARLAIDQVRVDDALEGRRRDRQYTGGGEFKRSRSTRSALELLRL